MKKLISILFVMVLTFTQIACSNIGDSKESNSDISENTSSVDDDGDKPILPERDMDGKKFYCS